MAREFGAYLKCGRLEYGFLRVRCESCFWLIRQVGFTHSTDRTAGDDRNRLVIEHQLQAGLLTICCLFFLYFYGETLHTCSEVGTVNRGMLPAFFIIWRCGR